MTQKGTNTIVLGAQWGDEGKGRITDLLAESAQVVVRATGGMNAGHTVIVGDTKFELHLVPSGVLHPEKKSIIGNGVVLHPESLVKELDILESQGISADNLWISDIAQITMPYHLQLDQLEEQRKGKQQIGTTRKGIGPSYTDKTARRGIRMGDLLEPETLHQLLEQHLPWVNTILTQVYHAEPYTAKTIEDNIRPFVERLRSYVTDTVVLLDQCRRNGDNILFEGAQGTLLDLDHGTYPFVTSSYPTAGGVCTGSGIGPTHIDEVIGVVKAYITRVGAGPFVTELTDEMGQLLQEKGHEFGVTTGRPRRCGWLDIPLLRHAIRVNGLTQLVLTKLDVLTGFKTIPLCTHYRINGENISDLSPRVSVLEQATPVYEELPGWEENITAVRTFADLPQQTRDYIERIEELVETKISLMSLGPEREQAIWR